MDMSRFELVDAPQASPAQGGGLADRFDLVADPGTPWKEVAWRALKNITKSAVEYGSNIAQAVSHPADTLDGLGSIARGGVDQLTPGTLRTVTDMDKKRWDSFKQMVSDRYGGLENIKNTIAEDPVGVAGDVASVASMGAGVSKLAQLPKAAGLMSSVANATEPISLAGKAAGMVPGVGWAMSKFNPEGMYASALKMGTKLPPDERAGILQTLLKDNRVVLDEAGAGKLGGRITGLESQVDPIIQRGVSEGKMVDPLSVARRIDDVLPQYNTVTRAESQAPIERIRQAFLDENTINMPNGQTLPVAIPLDEAQAKKVNTYKENSRAYETNSRPSGDSDARKALARGLKEEIASAVPDIAPINDELSRLYPAMDWVNAALNRSQNWNPTGMGGIMGVATGNLPGAIALDVSRTPRFLSKSAINLDRLRNAWGLMAPDNETLAMLRAAGYATDQ